MFRETKKVENPRFIGLNLKILSILQELTDEDRSPSSPQKLVDDRHVSVYDEVIWNESCF